MNVGKRFRGQVLFLLVASAAMHGQNIASPGELPSSAKSRLTSLNPSAGASPVLPKTSIANVADSPNRTMRKVWVASIFAMAAGTTADAVSSWHKRESNGFLASSDGAFGAKGLALKAGIAAGILTPQIILRKHREWRAAFAVGNFAEAGIFTGATIHNVRVK